MSLRRMLGLGGPSLSQISYGSMRLSEAPDRPSPIDLLLRLHDAGIDTHHSSSEYDSYPLYRAALEQLIRTGRRVQHIVKLAEPSFDDVAFDAGRLRNAIDARLDELGADQLAVVQWMVRTPNPADEIRPFEVVHHQRCEIVAAFDELKQEGKVGEVAIFPYSNRFAVAALHELGPHALCGYLSLFERDSVELLRPQQPFIALRPFAGAEPSVELAPEAAIAEPDSTRCYEAALRYPLMHPAVATSVVSVNSDEHVDLAIAVAQSATANLAEFDQRNWQLAERQVEVA